MDNSAGSKNVSTTRAKIPQQSIENKELDKTSQAEGRLSTGKKVVAVKGIKLKKANTDVAKTSSSKRIGTRRITSFIKLRGVRKKAEKLINKTIISDEYQKKQENLAEMLKDYEDMKSCEKMSKIFSAKAQHATLQGKYNIKNSLDLLLLIKEQNKFIPKTKKQVDNLIHEFNQKSEDLEKYTQATAHDIITKQNNATSEYGDHIRNIKQLKEIIEEELDPELLKKAEDDLAKAKSTLEVANYNCESLVDALDFWGIDVIQKKIDLYLKETNKIINELSKLPNKKQDKFKNKIMQLTKNRDTILSNIKKHISGIEQNTMASTISRDEKNKHI